MAARALRSSSWLADLRSTARNDSCDTAFRTLPPPIMPTLMTVHRSGGESGTEISHIRWTALATARFGLATLLLCIV
jgi:hypothetical protein